MSDAGAPLQRPKGLLSDENNQRKSSPAHGGKRKNAGRKPGSANKITVLIKGSLAETAKTYTGEAIGVLVEIMLDPEQPASARAICANGLLDRGHGKPTQAVEHTGAGGKPIETKDVSEQRTPAELARLVAHVLATAAIEKMKAQKGESPSAPQPKAKAKKR